MGWPQYVYLGLNLLSCGYLLAKGKVEVSGVGTLTGWVLVTLPLLYFGGFFS